MSLSLSWMLKARGYYSTSKRLEEFKASPQVYSNAVLNSQEKIVKG